MICERRGKNKSNRARFPVRQCRNIPCTRLLDYAYYDNDSMEFDLSDHRYNQLFIRTENQYTDV